MAGMDKGSAWATAAGVGAILLWSATVALTRSVSEHFGPLAAGAVIFTCGGVLMLVIDPVRLRPGKGTPFNRAYLLGCGGLFLLYTLAFYLAIGLAKDRAQAVELALLNYLWPSLTILFSLFVLPVKGKWTVFPGLVLAFSGIVLVMGSSGEARWGDFAGHVSGNPVAYGAAVTAGVTWGLYSVLTRRWAPVKGSATSLFMLLSGLSLGAIAVAQGWHAKPLPVRTGIELAALVISTALAYALWDVAMRRGRITQVAAASNFTPLLSTLISCAYLGVTPAARVWVGSAVIAAGSLVCWLSVKEEEEGVRG